MIIRLHIVVILTALLLTLGLIGSLGATVKGVTVPRALAVTSCETTEFISVLRGGQVLRVPIDAWSQSDYVIPPFVHNWRDLEWNIVDGKLDCKHEIIDLVDAAEIKGMPGINSDFSRHLICNMAAASYAPKYNEKHHGWAVMAVGCPNALLSDNGTPNDNRDDHIVGYKMPECPSEINETIIKCLFSENEI